MKIRNKKINITIKSIIYTAILLFIILYGIMFYNIYFPISNTYAKETSSEAEEQIKISNAKTINIEGIIEKNINNEQVEKITKTEESLEYLTEYRTNKEIPKGISYVIQEGREGKQESLIKTIYDKQGNAISEKQISSTITKASINKIVEIGGASYTSNYKEKVGDVLYVTSNILAVMQEADENSRKITTLKQDCEIKLLEIKTNWYKISYENIVGWVKAENTAYIGIKNAKEQGNETKKTKQQLLAELKFEMKLNKPSGLTIDQFKKILNDDKDKKNIFKNNAEYFYYIEKQYNINGVFVASIGIHESAWGTSEIAVNKNNLFGYGANDSNPYNGAYNFTKYSESIDLLARVLVKYYINPEGTSIYGGEKAIGTYYNGATLTDVNTKYASDKNWASSVFYYMKYLYNKL